MMESSGLSDSQRSEADRNADRERERERNLILLDPETNHSFTVMSKAEVNIVIARISKLVSSQEIRERPWKDIATDLRELINAPRPTDFEAIWEKIRNFAPDLVGKTDEDSGEKLLKKEIMRSMFSPEVLKAHESFWRKYLPFFK